MNAVAAIKKMDWSRFTIDEWLKQYAAFLSVSRMKGGHEPDSLEVNTIYWLVRENDKSGRSSNGKFVYLQIEEYEYDQIDKLINSVVNDSSICKSAQVCVQLYLKKMIEGLTEKQMGNMFVYSESSIRNMVFAGRYYLAGHDKRLVLDT